MTQTMFITRKEFTCCRCNRTLLATKFSRNHRNKTKHEYACKDCSREYQLKLKAAAKARFDKFPAEYWENTVKTCCTCKKTLPLNKFYLSVLHKLGVQGACKRCTAVHASFIQARKQDTYKNRAFEITLSQWSVLCSQPCHYCGFQSTGLDRVDNALGHSVSNCVPACYECNIARNSLWSVEEMKVIGATIRELKLRRQRETVS